MSLCPELDIAGQGDTIEEARNNLREAVELFFETASPNEIQTRLHQEVYVTQVEVSAVHFNRSSASQVCPKVSSNHEKHPESALRIRESRPNHGCRQDALDVNAGHFPASFHALEGISETLADVTIKHIDSGVLIDADSTQSYPTSGNRIKPDWRFRDAVGICSGGASPCKVRDPPG